MYVIARDFALRAHLPEAYNTGVNQHRLANWIRNNNRGVIRADDHFNPRSQVTVPRDVLSVARIIDPIDPRRPDEPAAPQAVNEPGRRVHLWEQVLYEIATGRTLAEIRLNFPLVDIDYSRITHFYRMPTPREVINSVFVSAGITEEMLIEMQYQISGERHTLENIEAPIAAYIGNSGLALPDGTIYANLAPPRRDTPEKFLALILHEIHHQYQFQNAQRKDGIEGVRRVVFQLMDEAFLHRSYDVYGHDDDQEPLRWFLEREAQLIEDAANDFLEERRNQPA